MFVDDETPVVFLVRPLDTRENKRRAIESGDGLQFDAYLNAIRHGQLRKLALYCADGGDDADLPPGRGDVDCVVANILVGPVTELAPLFARYVKEGWLTEGGASARKDTRVSGGHPYTTTTGHQAITLPLYI